MFTARLYYSCKKDGFVPYSYVLICHLAFFLQSNLVLPVYGLERLSSCLYSHERHIFVMGV